MQVDELLGLPLRTTAEATSAAAEIIRIDDVGGHNGIRIGIRVAPSLSEVKTPDIEVVRSVVPDMS